MVSGSTWCIDQVKLIKTLPHSWFGRLIKTMVSFNYKQSSEDQNIVDETSVKRFEDTFLRSCGIVLRHQINHRHCT